MTQQKSHTIEQYHELFHHFLMGKFEGDVQEVNMFVETVEEVLPFTLNEYFGTVYGSIYDIQGENEIESLRKKIKAHNILKNLDLREEPRYTEVLKWYKLFLKSLNKEKTPLLVPGEQEAYPTEVADHPEPPVKHNDADYAPDTEGLEHQLDISKYLDYLEAISKWVRLNSHVAYGTGL